MSIAAKFRTINQQIVASQALAAQKCQANTTKTEAARVIKSACPALHITRGRYQALDLLLGATRSGDWVDDREPIATLSNAYLANALACSERTVSRLLKGLVETGILAYRDSPTGRRFRSKNGQEVYGLSFAPARQRLDELRDLAQEHRAKLASDRAAKRAVEQALRSLEDLRIQAENGGVDFTRIEADALAIKDMAADRATKAEALSILLEGAWTKVDQAGVLQTFQQDKATLRSAVFSFFVNLLKSEELREQIILFVDSPIASEAETLLQPEHSLETGNRSSRRFEGLKTAGLWHVLLHSEMVAFDPLL